MEENTQEKNLIEKEEKINLFGKIKKFFKNLFGKKQIEVVEEEPSEKENNNEFRDSIKMTEDEEIKLLDLQRRYRRGEIAENDLTDEQIDALCDLYDKQIEELKESIRIKEEKIEAAGIGAADRFENDSFEGCLERIRRHIRGKM